MNLILNWVAGTVWFYLFILDWLQSFRFQEAVTPEVLLMGKQGRTGTLTPDLLGSAVNKLITVEVNRLKVTSWKEDFRKNFRTSPSGETSAGTMRSDHCS